MKRRTIIGLSVIVIFSAFAFYTFRSALNPYVSFAEAANTPRTVQVAGSLDKDSISYDSSANELRFFLVDQGGTRALVVYEGAKPNNLEHAESVVVIGNYGDGAFRARKLLVKCPSKYAEGKGK
jgi:cytochrome c-type biogenesis protein CcmE